eukprot:gene17323-19056_t
MELEQSQQQSLSSFSQGDLPELLVQYYTRLFPYEEFYNWLCYGKDPNKYFAKREFSFTLKDDVYIRFLSFNDCKEFEKEIQKRQPYKIDIGAVYNSRPKEHKQLCAGQFIATEKELVFDIDMTDYDDVRTCCSGAAICERCWPLMTLAIRIIDRTLLEDFGFKHRLWVYSGRRGVHCWVCDEEARKLSQGARTAIAEYLSLIKGGENQAKKVNFGRNIHPSIAKSLSFVTEFFKKKFLIEQGILDCEENWKNVLAIIPDDSVRAKLNNMWQNHGADVAGKQKWEELCKELERHKMFGRKFADEIMCQYVYPRLDVNVSKGINHLLKSPFCVHPKTGRVCVPIDTQKLDEFDPFTVPTISTLCQEIDSYDKKFNEKNSEDNMEVDEKAANVKLKNVKGGAGLKVVNYYGIEIVLSAYEKTSLLQGMELFKKFIVKMEKSRTIKEEQRKISKVQIKNRNAEHKNKMAQNEKIGKLPEENEPDKIASPVMENANIDSESLRLLVGYESSNCKYSERVLYCIIHVIEDTVLKKTSAESYSALELALRCFLKLFQDLALLDHIKILPRMVNVLKLSVTADRLPKQLKLCGKSDPLAAMKFYFMPFVKALSLHKKGCIALETLIDLVESSHLKLKFATWKDIIIDNLVDSKVDVFSRLGEFLNFQLSDDILSNKRLEVSVNLITCLIKERHCFKRVFKQCLSFERLEMYIRRIQKHSRELIESLFKLTTPGNKTLSVELASIYQLPLMHWQLLVNGEWVADNYSSVIANGEITCVLIDLVPLLSQELQRYVCETLRVMCATVNHNRIISCQFDLIGNILSLLEKNGSNLSKQILCCLISLLEILGSHSINPQQLKHLIGLFRANGDKKQVSYSDRLLQALERMASQVDERQPRNFVDFYDPTEVFAPPIHKLGGKGVTFHTWLCLDFGITTPKRHRTAAGKIRHMLYCFLNSHGEGFEAFFTENGILVVAVCTKKEYLSTSIVDLPFDDQEWHSVAIVHTKKSLGRSHVTILLDGQLCHESVMKYPVTEDLIHSHIGYGVRYNPNFQYNIHPPPAPSKAPKSLDFPDCIAAGQQNKFWGDVFMLKGQMSSVRLFNESLSQSILAEMHFAGPNNWNNSGLSDAVEIQSHLNDVSKQCVLHYDAKAASENYCLNLCSVSNDRTKHPTILNARVIHTWDIKSSIQCIGGLQVLFPLLEQVQYCEETERKISRDASFALPKNDISTIDMNSEMGTSVSVVEGGTSIPTSPMDFNHCSGELHEQRMSNSGYCEGVSTGTDNDEPEPRPRAISGDKEANVARDTLDELRKANRSSPDSFLVVESPQSPMAKAKQDQGNEDWILVDKTASSRTRNFTFTRWANEKDYYDLNGASYFISLLRNMLVSQRAAQESFIQSKGVQLMGLLLQKCDARIINIGFLMSLQSLVEGLAESKMELQQAVYKYILFDFRIWSDSDISLRIAHVQLISTYVKDKPGYFKELFGVGFLLKIVCSHYLEQGRVQKRESSAELIDEHQKSIRVAILGLVFFYLKSGSNSADVNALVSYITVLTDLVYLDEVVELLKHGLEVPSDDAGKFILHIAESNCANILTRWLVHDCSEKTRLCILRIFYLLLSSNKLSEALKAKIRLTDVGYASVCTLLSKQSVSRDVIVALLKLALSFEQTAYKGVDIYLHFDIVFAILYVVRQQPLPVKLEVALKIRNSLKSSMKSARKCANETGWYEPFLQLIVVQPQDQSIMAAEPDVMQEELTSVTLEILHIAMWKGIDGSDLTVWRDRAQPLAALHQMASTYTFILPVLVIERQLLTKCIQACSNALNESMQPWAVDSQNSVQVVKLVEDFLLSTEFSGTPHEAMSEKWDIELLDSLHTLLNSMNAWEDSSEGGSEWTDALHIVEKILYACAVSDDIKFVSYAAKKLHKMLSRRNVSSQEEACYEIGHINDIYLNLKQREDNTHSLFIPVFRLCFERFGELLNASKHLPDLPSLDPSTHVFEEVFPEFFSRGQYVHFANQVARISKVYQETKFASTLIDIGRFWMDCLSGMDAAVKERGHRMEQSLQNFSRSIYAVFEESRNAANVSQVEFETYRKYDLTMTNRLWVDTKRILTSERGAWTERNPSRIYWKLSSMENSSRMRLKLTRDFNSNDHSEASRARDQGTTAVTSSDQITDINISVMTEATEELVLSGEEDADDIEDGVEQKEPTEHLYDLNPIEVAVGKVIMTVKCHLVTLMDLVPGNLELTSSHVSFYDEANDSLFGAASDFRFPLDELIEMHMRRYNLRKSGLEFFLGDSLTFFINFANEQERNKFFKKTTSQRPVNLRYTGIKSPQKLLRVSHLTQRWVRREITNFDYLMQLNTIAGRTYNDLAQYPVFPWVIVDYESVDLDLDDPAVYRDLSKPIGALNPKKLRDIQDRYDSCIDPSGLQKPCHYLTHYSNASVVLQYLLRIDPFTSLHIKLQGGKFDLADRQFYSILSTWRSIHDGYGDIREMIPEFYCFPDFLLNINNLDIGRLQKGDIINNVVLPPWAASPEEFIYKLRLALESDYVSANLHNWIDLIFGYKQKGEAAIEALNVFHHYSYAGAVDLDSITNENDRQAIEGVINNFGQTPCQLLTKPHPARKTASEVLRGDKKAPKVLDKLKQDEVNCSLLKINPDGPPLIFIGTQRSCQRSLLSHGMPDPMITVDVNGSVGFHGWLPFSESSSGSFAFSLDLKFAARSHKRNSLPKLPGVWSPQVSASSSLFAMTMDGKLLICCGYWDNSIRVFNGKGKTLSLLCQHLEVVTCLSLDPSDRYFISGSRDTRCMVWRIEHHSGVATDVTKRPLQTLYGHDDVVNTVAMSWELDIAVSGSRDGTCIVHTIKKGQFARSLRPDSSFLYCDISKVCLTKYGRIIINSRHTSSKDELVQSRFGGVLVWLVTNDIDNPQQSFTLSKSDTLQVENILTMYSVNGSLISTLKLTESILDMLVIEDNLITGGERGSLVVRHVYKLDTPLVAKNLQHSIHCVAVTPDGSHIFAGRSNGTIVVIGP